VDHVFEATLGQLLLVRQLVFYDSIYKLDDIERPSEKIISDDDALDRWHINYNNYVHKELVKYHKGRKTPGVDMGVPDARISMGKR